MNELRDFMFAKVYRRPEAVAEEKRAGLLIEMLYAHYTRSPHDMPAEFLDIWESEGERAAVCDHIASMTDRYAVREFKKLFLPSPMM
jgi:dGTPase